MRPCQRRARRLRVDQLGAAVAMFVAANHRVQAGIAAAGGEHYLRKAEKLRLRWGLRLQLANTGGAHDGRGSPEFRDERKSPDPKMKRPGRSTFRPSLPGRPAQLGSR